MRDDMLTAKERLSLDEIASLRIVEAIEHLQNQVRRAEERGLHVRVSCDTGARTFGHMDVHRFMKRNGIHILSKTVEMTKIQSTSE